MFPKPRLRGVTAVQMAVVLAVIAMVVIGSVQLLGTTTNDELNNAASYVSDPGNYFNDQDGP